MIPGYGKIIALDKSRFTAGVLDGPCVIQEKVDGSQVSFALEEIPFIDGEGDPKAVGFTPLVRSKNQVASGSQFMLVITTVNRLNNTIGLNPDYIYRGEAVTKPKHNTLKYDRIPKGGVILFDIEDRATGRMLMPNAVLAEAHRLGLETVPYFAKGDEPVDELKLHRFMKYTSCLGGAKIEGIVIKRYDRPDPTLEQYGDGLNKGFLKVKLVSQEFKEVHHKDWKGRNPGTNDVVQNLIEELATDARIDKAIQHLRDEGKLTDTVADIGPIMGEVSRDVTEEEADYIAKKLWQHFGKRVLQGVAKRVPDYYKAKLGQVEAA